MEIECKPQSGRGIDKKNEWILLSIADNVHGNIWNEWLFFWYMPKKNAINTYLESNFSFWKLKNGI